LFPLSAGLWRQRDFLKLWVAATGSNLGLHVGMVVLPLTAVLTLGAGAAEMGLLRALGTAPALMFGLFAGAWVDRRQRRPIMVVAEFGRAIVLCAVPVAAVLGLLRMELLYLVAVLGGTLAIVSDVAYMAFLPALVGRGRLVEANSKLFIGWSLAEMVGPSLAGALVQAITAPVALLASALARLLAAVTFGLIRVVEPDFAPHSARRPLLTEVREGLVAVWGHPMLRPIAAYLVCFVLAANVQFAVYVLYLTREVDLEPALLGAVLAAAGPGSLLGGLVSARLTRQWGPGRVIAGGVLLSGLAALLIPSAGGPQLLMVALLASAQFLLAFGMVIMSVNQMSLRQGLTAHRLQGRMNATFRSINLGAAMLGALTGGILGEYVGLRLTMVVGALGILLASLWLLLSPVRTLRELPAPVPEPAPAGT
jgi:predicted MFS family arabinose efflux permease